MKITKRRPALEYKLINDTDDLFGSIFHVTPVAIILLSWPQKVVVKANKAALSLLKVRTMAALMEKHQSFFAKFSDDTFKGRDFFEIEIKARNPRGTVLYLVAKARKIDGSQVVVTLEDITKFKNKEKKLLKLAQIDGLTGVFNHKTIMERFKEEFARAKRYHLPLSCFMFDVDNFKSINDVYGHLQGDNLLKKIAHILKTNIRETDIIGRYGGDEFLIIMPETPLSESFIPAKRIQACVVEKPFIFGPKNVEIKMTFSIGISGYPLNDLETVKAIIGHADKGLYESKVRGGNNIILSQA